jgi:LPS export ABC transporter protein LptC
MDESEDSIVCASRKLCISIVISKLVPVLLLVACTEGPPRMVVDPDLAAMEADYIIFGLTDNVTRGGVREFLLEADTALIFQDSTVVLLRGNVTLTTYNEKLGTEKAVVTSDRGRLDKSTNEMLAEGNSVLLIRSDGRRIESYELRYTPDSNLLQSDSVVVMYDGDDVVEGTSFNSDLNFDRVNITNARTRGGTVRF